MRGLTCTGEFSRDSDCPWKFPAGAGLGVRVMRGTVLVGGDRRGSA
jgi:hypothetical protein